MMICCCEERDQCRVGEGLFLALRLATNVADNNLPFKLAENGSIIVETAHDEVEGIKKFFNKENLKALMSVGDTWKNSFNNAVANIVKTYKTRCSCMRKLDDDNVLTLESHEVETTETCVRILNTDTKLSGLTIGCAEWTDIMHIINKNLNAGDN